MCYIVVRHPVGVVVRKNDGIGGACELEFRETQKTMRTARKFRFGVLNPLDISSTELVVDDYLKQLLMAV